MFIQQIEAQHNILQATLNSIGEGVVVADKHGKFIQFNPAAEQILGIGSLDVDPTQWQSTYGTYLPDMVTPYLSEELPLARAIRGEETTAIAMYIRNPKKPDGVWLNVTGRPIKEENEVIGGVVVIRDVTEHKQEEEVLKQQTEKLIKSKKILEAQNNILQATLNSIGEGVVVADKHGKFIQFNPAAEQILGIGSLDLDLTQWQSTYGTYLPDMVTPYLSEELPLARAIRGEETTAIAMYIRNLQKTTGIWLNVTGRPIKEENEVIGGVVIIRDVTEHKHAEEQLLQERAMLARRIEESTADLRLTNAQLKRANQMKDEFLANMSHELRTPLNAIIGLSEVLQEGVYGKLQEKQLSSLNIIKESGYHLLSLINDILDLSKIEAGKLELFRDWVYIDSLCQSSLAFIKQTAAKKFLKTSFVIDNQTAKIWADGKRLKQILINMLTNAVKFTPERGSIGLEVNCNQQDQTIRFDVWDTGIGIEQSNLERIFQPFVQIDSALSRQQDGTGLGLALIAKLVDLHEASIFVKSELGKGSRFSVVIPWQETQENSASYTSSEKNNYFLKTFKKILLIEDSLSTIEQLTHYLKDFGIESEVYSNENNIVQQVQHIQPDIILLDILLPNISGWQILTELKDNIKTRDIPVLIISVVDEQQQAQALGAFGYLVKPITRKQLQDALGHILSLLETIKSNGTKCSENSNLLSTTLVNSKQHLILLAEDNENNLSAFFDYLHMIGYKVIVARNGFEAIARAKEYKPDIILMDIQMPGMDGLKAIHKIKDDSSLCSIPIIAITALAMPNDKERCLKAGANDYLSKPISLKNLAKSIEQHLVK